MTGRGIRLGGGGKPNFAVVSGGVRPVSPKPNTIWINSGTAVTDVVFSKTSPGRRSGGGALSGGEVWVETWRYSPNPFEAYPGATVYPVAVYQRSGSSWVRQSAEFWDGSAWKVWDPFCYRYGTVYTDPGGGIALKNSIVSGGSAIISSAAFDSSCIKLTCTASRRSGYAYFCTKSNVDLTNYRYIRFRGWASAAPDGNRRFVHIGVMSTPASILTDVSYTKKYIEVPSAGSFDIKIDVGNFTNSLYVRGEAHGGGDSEDNYPMTAEIYEIQCIQ